FVERDVPKYLAGVLKAMPRAATIPPDCLGVLLSLAYNRGNGGWTLDGDRYKEMRQVRALVQAGDIELVSRQIRLMCRLWPSADPDKADRGLRARREREAKIWDEGLRSSDPPAMTIRNSEKPRKTLPGPPKGSPEVIATTGVLIGTAGASADA